MRILHTSDWHVGRTIRGRSREGEHVALLTELLEIVEDERVDLVLVAGDQFDSAVPTAGAERVVWRALLGCADRGAQVVVVAGNHDNAARLEAVSPLLARAGIVAAAHVRAGGTTRVETKNGDANIALVPFLSQRGIVKTADLLDRDAAQHAQAYADRVRVVLASLARDFGRGDAVDLVVAHLAVVGTGGMLLGGGERASHIFDYVVPPQAFPASAHYVALGHLHQPHDVPGPAPIRYCGSPLHLDFGEVASQRGLTIVDVEPGTPAVIRHRPLRAGYALLTLRGSLAELRAAAGELDAQVYVRAIVDEEPRAGLADDVRAAVPQAVDVRVAERVATTGDALEADEAAAADPAELFASYLAAKGVADERVPALFRALYEELDESRCDPST